MTSKKSDVTITAWDLGLDGSLTAGTLAITIHGAQASQTIGLGAVTTTNMDIADGELGRMTAEGGVTLGSTISGSIVVDGVTDGTAATLPGTDLGGGGRFFTFSLTADEMRDRDDPAVQLALRRRRRGAPPVKLSEFGDVALEAVEAAAMVSDSKKKKPGLLARLLGNKGPAGARMRR